MIAIPLRHMYLLPLQLFGSLTSAAFLQESGCFWHPYHSLGSRHLGYGVSVSSFIGCFMVLSKGSRKACCATKYIDFLAVSISRYFIQIQVKFEGAKRKHNDILRA